MNLDTYATIHDLGHGAAIEHASRMGWTLHTYSDPTADAVEDCTVEYAQDCAQADPGLVWMTPGDNQVAALQDEANEAGDFAQAALCTSALDGDTEARAECARVIADAANMSDDGSSR